MGCGGSRFNRENDPTPVRVHPLLRRRIEEIKRVKNANGLKDSTPSTKELLHRGNDEDDETDSSRARSLHEKEECKEEEVKRVAAEDEDEDKEGEIDEEGCVRIGDRYICPGSPSFRVYYEESLHNKQVDDDESKTESGMTESSHGDESISAHSTESSVNEISKKERKGRKFRNVMHKGGHVKHLLNVKSCYNPAASSHNNARIVQKEAAA